MEDLEKCKYCLHLHGCRPLMTELRLAGNLEPLESKCDDFMLDEILDETIIYYEDNIKELEENYEDELAELNYQLNGYENGRW